MTREEFTERVGLNVSDGIFEVWNGVYIDSWDREVFQTQNRAMVGFLSEQFGI